MFSNEKEALKRLESEQNFLNEIFSDKEIESHSAPEASGEFKIEDILSPKEKDRRGRGREYTNEERADIAVVSKVIGIPQTQELLGVSSAQPANNRNGKINYYDKATDKELESLYRSRITAIRNITSEKLLGVLGVIDDQSVENLRGNALKASQVAGNLAKINEKLAPADEKSSSATFVIIAPQHAKEEQYEVIDV